MKSDGWNDESPDRLAEFLRALGPDQIAALIRGNKGELLVEATSIGLEAECMIQNVERWRQEAQGRLAATQSKEQAGEQLGRYTTHEAEKMLAQEEASVARMVELAQKLITDSAAFSSLVSAGGEVSAAQKKLREDRKAAAEAMRREQDARAERAQQLVLGEEKLIEALIETRTGRADAETRNRAAVQLRKEAEERCAEAQRALLDAVATVAETEKECQRNFHATDNAIMFSLDGFQWRGTRVKGGGLIDKHQGGGLVDKHQCMAKTLRGEQCQRFCYTGLCHIHQK